MTRHGTWKRSLVMGAGLVCFLPAAVVGGIATGLADLPASAAPSASARTDIPAPLLPLYQDAASLCPGLSWAVLAGLGKVESNHHRPPRQTSSAGAQGPMQFLPGTWTQYGVDGDDDGQADPFQPADAIPAAAAYLCAHGATQNLPRAVAAYLCGAVPSCLAAAQRPDGYASRVLAWAHRYTESSQSGGVAATVAVQAALAQLGTPYQWGGETPSGGFDCSGLVQYAYQHAQITLPRTAQTQYDVGPHLPAGTPPQPGDLVFFGPSSRDVTHVGIAIGDGRMVDAPHSGAFVRVEPIAGFGHYLGATRPIGLVGGVG